MAISKIKDTAGNVHDISVTWDNVTGKPDAFIDFGTCATAAATAAKVVTMTDADWSLEVGNIIGVKFTNSNSASSVTLNVNNSGAKNIYYNNASYTGSSTSICGYANRVLFYMYDGTYWVWLNMGSLDGNTNTIPSAYCETGGATKAKIASCTNYNLLSKSFLHVIFAFSNTAKSDLTLTVNGRGAKPIYINGEPSSSSNYTLPRGTYIAYYDGTNYYFRTDGKLTVGGIICEDGDISVTSGKVETPTLHITTGETEGGKIVFGDFGADIDTHYSAEIDDGHYCCIEEINDDELTFTAGNGFEFDGGRIRSNGTEVSLEGHTHYLSVTYSELLNLRINGELIPGQQYRITDYVTTTAQENTKSAGHRFDIIVTALDEYTLCEEAKAIQNDTDDGYFDECNLSAWKIWYSLDNDSGRFKWANTYNYDSDNGLYEFNNWVTAVAKVCDDQIDTFYEVDINEKFSHFGYTEDLDGITRLTLYGRDLDGDTDEGLNTGVLYHYKGVYNVDGVDYDGWAQFMIEQDIYAADANGNPIYVLTERIVYNGEIIRGKGVIYRMIDEWGNDCPYDFKNIMFKRGLFEDGFGVTTREGDWDFETYCYTFSWEETQNEILDASTIGNYGYLLNDEDQISGVYGNVIGVYYDYEGEQNYITQQYLNDIVFFSTFGYDDGCYYGCYNNTFGNDCRNNTFGNDCQNNTFGNRCSINTFGNECYINTFGNSCWFNTFGDNCYYNTFGTECSRNTFGNDCYINTFGSDCHDNTFGTDCCYNTFDSGCESNTFGNGCSSNTFDSGCYDNTFGNYCQNNTFGSDCNQNNFGGSCKKNTFGNGCYKNTFGDGCENNTFSNNCYENSFSDSCSNNTFGDLCYNNEFGYGCYDNTFGNYCQNNTFSNNCKSNAFSTNCCDNTFDANCVSNTFGNGCCENAFSTYCSSNTFGDYCCQTTFGDRCEYNTFGNRCSINTFGNECYRNTFGTDCYGNTFYDGCCSNTFGNDCYSNDLGNGCFINTFGNECYENTFETDCYYNTFDNFCYSNTFGSTCSINTFGNYCIGNTFGNNCYYNTFGNGCNANTFGNECSRNTFGNECIGNEFGTYCVSNTFGNGCTSNTFGKLSSSGEKVTKSYYENIIFDNNNKNIYLNCTQTTSSSYIYKNVRIGLGVNNSSTTKTIDDSNINQNYETLYVSKDNKTITI